MLTYQEAIVTSYGNTLTIDFGEVGYWNSKHPFRLKLELVQGCPSLAAELRPVAKFR
jgi:hypothetical protein